MPLSTHSVDTYPETSSHAILSGNIRPQSSQLAEPLWTNSGMKSGISVRELISTLHFKKKKKLKTPGGKCTVEHSPQILASEEKATISVLLCIVLHRIVL